MHEEDYRPGNPDLAGDPGMVVLTGCSGSGKSTLLAELARRGVAVVPEAGRQIVREEMQIGGAALPWSNVEAFIMLLASRAMAQFNGVRRQDLPVVFDRSIVDAVSHLEYLGQPVPVSLRKACSIYRYAPQVFVTPPWAEIYVDDGERNKPFETACGEYEALTATYRGLGYDLVEVPRDDVARRADFILKTLDR